METTVEELGNEGCVLECLLTLELSLSSTVCTQLVVMRLREELHNYIIRRL